MTDAGHLTEGQLQGAADGSLDAEQMRSAYAHLAGCERCAADVARLRTVMIRARDAIPGAPSLDDLWPGIRSRIEESKVVRLGGAAAPTQRARPRRPWLAIASTAVAAALLIAAVVEMQGWRGSATAAAPPPASDAAFASAVDSTRVYEEESRRLLNDLEMQRALMGPSASASLSGDLAIVDRSIAEQKEALGRDPRNIALQRLLASAYRKKVELLRRAVNAS
jgi:anti-sigma factor RsiW